MNWKYETLITLRPFQHEFIKYALMPGIHTAALSLPKGNGKSTLAAFLALQTLLPESPLFVRGAENHIVSSSVGQSRRSTFGILRRMLAQVPNWGRDYRVTDNATSARIVHPQSLTEVSVLPANSKAAQGIVHARLVIADEPGAWKVGDGEEMHDTLQATVGKPGVNLRLLYIGTLAPAGRGHWWPELIEDGGDGLTHVTFYGGTPEEVAERWDTWPLIRRSNPLMSHFPESRRVLLAERDKARRDSRLQARFCSYRLNCPSRDRSEMVLTVADFERASNRTLPVRDGAPVVGLDLGQGRAWSSAVALWPSGRCEAVAVAPGLPSIEAQERRDRVPKGTYRRLIEVGSLTVAEGLRVPPVASIMRQIREWQPRVILCDRFRYGEVLDSNPPCLVVPRVSRWSSSTEDITHLRRMAADGPLSIAVGSRHLLAASLSAAKVITDDAGNVRLSKSKENTARDDVAASLILSAGEWGRRYAGETQEPVFVFAPSNGPVAVM